MLVLSVCVCVTDVTSTKMLVLSVCVCVTDVTSTNEPGLRENTREDRDVIV